MNVRHLAIAARQLAGSVDRRALTDGEQDAVADLIERLSAPDVELLRPEDLLGAKEAAALLGVEKSTLTRWRREGYLPEPFAAPASGPVWLRDALERFTEQHAQHADAAGRRPVGSRTAAPAA